MGDQYEVSKPFQVVNVNSTLTNVVQNIQANPEMQQTTRDELTRLFAELTTLLHTVPRQHERAIQKVARRADDLFKELNSPEPDIDIIEANKNSLVKASDAIRQIAPTIWPVVMRIVALVDGYLA